jgi:hypothetical protein
MNDEEGVLERLWFGLGHALNDPLDWWSEASWGKRIGAFGCIVFAALVVWAHYVEAQRAEVQRQTECRNLRAALDEADDRHAYRALYVLQDEYDWKCALPEQQNGGE